VACATVASQRTLEEALTCQCGCGLTVHSCNHLQCSSSIPLKREIAEQIASGAPEDQILAYFQKKYGEKILSAPTTTGFNLTAWLMPFVAIGFGGVLVGMVLVRWRRTSNERPPTSLPAGDPQLRARLERELQDLDLRP
jgi:cytochrome c-type biogenesis protein CcmH